MFDTRKVAKKIKECRVAKNMTQMALADEMGVSYQAVSNWERGNSMPDISKIPHLCSILEVSFEELVGEDSSKTAAAKKVMEDENAPLSMEELAETAPLLPPEKIAKTVEDHFSSEESPIDMEVLLELAPFLDDEELELLVDKLSCSSRENFKEFHLLVPFLSEKALDKLIEKCLQEDLYSVPDFADLAPFLSEETLDKIVEKYLHTGAGSATDFTDLAPFLSEMSLKKIMTAMITSGHIEGLSAIAPFL